MRTLVIGNRKGGVGKTTTAICLGHALMLKGKRVLFIDMDSQQNASQIFSVDGDAENTTSLDVLAGNIQIKDAIVHTELGDIVPASRSLDKPDKYIDDLPGREHILANALAPIQDEYDYAIIDTPSQFGIVMINCVVASGSGTGGIIIPTQAEPLSIEGIANIVGSLNVVKQYYCDNVRVLGILLTTYGKNRKIERDLAEVIQDMAQKMDTKVYNTYTRRCTKVSEAQTVRQNLYDYAPNCTIAQDYLALADEIIGEEK